MSLEKEISISNEGPFDQFVKCHKDGSCKYKDTNDYCIFENCIVDGLMPKTVLLHYFECTICKRIDCIDPKDMKSHICRKCIERMRAVEVLPFNCNWCGKKVSSPTSWMFSGKCESCLGKIKAAAGCAKCGRSI